MRRWLAERGPDGRRHGPTSILTTTRAGSREGQPHLPEGLEDRVLYDPSGHGHEASLVDWVAELRALRRPPTPDH
jgi:hypothetical protein